MSRDPAIMRRVFTWIVTGSLCLGGVAWANKREVADLKREIDTQRAAVADLERLDDGHSATDETTLLRSWLDEAGGQLAKEELDKTRQVLARCIAQAELVRQKVAATKLTQKAGEREAALKASRDKLERTRRDLQQATVDKKALEMNTK
jgi:hypothetical protein